MTTGMEADIKGKSKTSCCALCPKRTQSLDPKLRGSAEGGIKNFSFYFWRDRGMEKRSYLLNQGDGCLEIWLRRTLRPSPDLMEKMVNIDDWSLHSCRVMRDLKKALSNHLLLYAQKKGLAVRIHSKMFRAFIQCLSLLQACVPVSCSGSI